MTTLEQSLRMERDGNVLTITLHRPEVLNALDDALLDRLAAALRTAAEDPSVRGLILTGAGRAFCMGQDLRDLHADGDDRAGHAATTGRRLRERYAPVILRLRSIEKPVVAAVNGIATGAGLALALACDLRLASTEAAFSAGAVTVGLIPAAGMTTLLPAIIGLGRAAELALTGDRVDAARAREIGLVNRVVAPEALMPAAHDLAARLAALPTTAIGLTKQALNRAALPDLAAQLLDEAERQEIAAGTDDHAEGVAALLEKRRPRFTGR